MKLNEQRIALFELEGWKARPDGTFYNPNPHYKVNQSLPELTFEAIHRFEEHLPPALRCDYLMYLVKHAKDRKGWSLVTDLNIYDAVHSTVEQRADSLCRCLFLGRFKAPSHERQTP